MLEFLKIEANKTYTENGAVTYRSTGRDCLDLFATIVQNLGYSVIRGSSTHGATNVRHLLAPLREGHFVGMALDGPRGPALQVKQGSPWLAKSSGRPLWLIDAKYGAHITLKTWDKFVLPLPLTSIDIEIKLSL